MKCSICPKPAAGEFVNPVNPEDRAHYCKKHLKAIGGSFRNFQELYHYEKNVQQNPLFRVQDEGGKDE